MRTTLQRPLQACAARALRAAFVPAALAVSAPGAAATLASASFELVLGSSPSMTFPGSGATGTATSQLSAGLDAGTALAGTATLFPASPPPGLTATQVVVTQNAGGTFTGTTPSRWAGASRSRAP